MEQNGVNAAEPMDIPPPLPLKSSTGDYGNVMDYQDFIPPATPPPPPHRVSKMTPLKGLVPKVLGYINKILLL